MYYVYVLLSTKNSDMYVGYTIDLRKRFRQHNRGESDATKFNHPWRLIYYEAYRNKRDATKREKQLKNHRAKIELKDQLRYSLGE